MKNINIITLIETFSINKSNEIVRVIPSTGRENFKPDYFSMRRHVGGSNRGEQCRTAPCRKRVFID